MSLSVPCNAVGGNVAPDSAETRCRVVWGFWSTIGWIVVATGAGNVAAKACSWCLHWASSPVSELAAAIAAAFAAVAVLAVAARRVHWSIGEYLGLVRPRLAGLLIGFAALYLLVLASEVACKLLGLSFQRNGGAESLAITQILYAVVLAPVFEEILFRGFLYRGWEQTRLGNAGTIVVSSLLFSAAHVHYELWFAFAYAFCLGLLFGWLRRRTGGIVIPILLHATVNAGNEFQMHWFDWLDRFMQ
jgi:membrane protease YdiL (CAAX protease family)